MKSGRVDNIHMVRGKDQIKTTNCACLRPLYKTTYYKKQFTCTFKSFDVVDLLIFSCIIPGFIK